MPDVTLINPFEVSAQRELEFLEQWKEATSFLRRQPGFISSQLHRSQDPNARFRFTNIQTWQSAAHFSAAIRHSRFVGIMDRMSFPHYAALYDPFLIAHSAVGAGAPVAPRARQRRAQPALQHPLASPA